jgi:Ca-activated chloride channel family protein
MTVFEWGTPLWFLALPAAILPFVAAWRPYALRVSALGPGHVQAPLRSGRSARTLLALLVPMAEAMSLALVVVALARPQLVEHETVRESDGIDILMAIDTSGSMDEPDMGPGLRPLSRLDAARMVMAKFAGEREWDRLGLLVFGEEAFIQVPLTLDHEGLADFVGQLEAGMAGKGTAIGDALAVGAKHMKELTAPSKVMILVTDGQSNTGHIAPAEAAKAAAALGIRVYTIGVGGDRMDERQLRGIAAATGGQFFRATDVNALTGVYQQIDSLEKTTAKVREYSFVTERYLDALVPAVLLFLGQLLLGATWLRRLP